MNLANRIKKQRIKLNMDRNTLAKGILSYSHLSNVELGRYEPSDEVLIALAKRLGVAEEYLLKYKEKDDDLEELLILLKSNIDISNLKDAEYIIQNIEKRYIRVISVYQESFFYLLKSYYLYKKGDCHKALEIQKKEVNTLLENISIDGFPSDFKETNYYMKGIECYYNQKFHNSYQYFVKYLSLANTTQLKGIANFNIALVLFKLNNIISAIQYAKKALDLHLHDRNWENVAQTDNLLGVLYWENNDNENAEKHLLNALETATQYKLKVLLTKILHNLGLVYKKVKKYNKSLEYFQLSLKIKKKSNQTDSLLMTYLSILNIYIEQELLEDAKLLLLEAKDNCQKEEFQYSLKIIEARIKLKLKDYALFEALMKESIAYFNKTNQWKYVKDIAEELGDYYFLSKKYKLSSKFLKMALQAIKNINQEGEYEKI